MYNAKTVKENGALIRYLEGILRLYGVMQLSV
jgi:hypothetical protein